jgi:lysophospholipase L1-like esterase
MEVFFSISLILNILFVVALGYKIYMHFFEKANPINITNDLYWKDKVSQYEILNSKQNGGILFVGDSMVERFQVEEFFSTFKIYNRGNAWDDTKSLLSRLNNTVLNKNPAKVIIYIGGNDILYKSPFSESIKNFEEIINSLKESNVEIVIISILPVWETNKRDNKDISKLNMLIQKLCAKHSIVFFDIHDRFLNQNGELKQEFSNDGVHMNGAGYKLFANQISVILDKNQLKE